MGRRHGHTSSSRGARGERRTAFPPNTTVAGPSHLSPPAQPADGPALVAVGTVVKPHGLSGEVAVELLTDFPERFGCLEDARGVGQPERRRLTGQVVEPCLDHTAARLTRPCGT